MTGKKFKGYLDRLRENVEVLDEAIANARKMSKPKGKADKAAALQWAKTLRDLVELRGTTLANIKAHMNGRDETGVVQEPPDLYDENPQIEFERYFRNLMTPWTPNDLKLKCEDCGIESEDVSHRDFQEIKDSHWRTVVEEEDADLCPQCVEKRNAHRSARYERAKDSTTTNPSPDMKVDLSTPEKCQQMIQRVQAAEAAGQLGPREAEVMLRVIRNALGLLDKQGTTGDPSA